ncbi:MFS transporter [Marinactinospora thermotolerans]|uniref:Drug resistance transporter, EmrB/QacA subfamily n=1 Tax=Marinactinospora thermotolerans DSM 45154 TaxID=1122192 RepID=A0A1T4KI85_9ACTN|nr:MFS transporter [Marinactinospora thermotolerans]SJZ42152.1 drug resistance transporter, EmrB/QacA subfamily [Marinactinospora thermotolerans DSM 45154]
MTDPSASSEGGRISGAALLTLLLLCAAQFMLIVDVVVVNVAVPSIRADLGIPDSRLPLVSVSYTLTFGSLLIAFGRAGDLVGRRRLFMIGMTVFTLASLATGLAQTEWQLVISRAGQGVGAAMVSPTALALLTTAFSEGAGRNRALGYWGAVGSGGAIAGQLLGGVITDAVGWRGIFLINVPIGIAALLLARYYLRESRAEQRPALDVRGAVLLTVALALTLLGLTGLAEGRNTAVVAGLVIACIVAFALFFRVERTHPAPLVDVRVVRSGNVAGANVLFAVSAGMLAAALFFTTLYLQVVLDYSPLAVGIAFAPITLLILLISPLAGTLTTRYGPRRVLLVAFGLLIAGLLLMARLPTDGNYFRDALPPLLLIAVGAALSYAPILIAGTTGVPERDQGLASGLLNSAQELGAAIGITVIGAIATAATFGATPEALTAGYRTGLFIAAAIIALSVLLVLRLGRSSTPSTEEAVATEAGEPPDRA